MNIAAFDLSLTATGWASTSEGLIDCGVMHPKKDYNRYERLRYIRDTVLRAADTSDVVVLEGYAFARANQAHQLGELGGVVRLALYEAMCASGRLFVEIPPASLKLFATGRGNAKKEEMLVAAVRRLGYDGHDHNVADALWLLRMAECGVGIRTPENDHQRRALAKITWPQLAGV